MSGAWWVWHRRSRACCCASTDNDCSSVLTRTYPTTCMGASPTCEMPDPIRTSLSDVTSDDTIRLQLPGIKGPCTHTARSVYTRPGSQWPTPGVASADTEDVSPAWRPQPAVGCTCVTAGHSREARSRQNPDKV